MPVSVSGQALRYIVQSMKIEYEEIHSVEVTEQYCCLILYFRYVCQNLLHSVSFIITTME